jgi:hypothetical protein
MALQHRANPQSSTRIAPTDQNRTPSSLVTVASPAPPVLLWMQTRVQKGKRMESLGTGTIEAEVVLDMAAAEIDASGRVNAELWMRFGADGWPRWGWRDCPAITLRWWLAEVRRLMKQQSDRATLTFADGPYEIAITQVGRYSIRMETIRTDTHGAFAPTAYVVRFDRFARSLCSAAHRFGLQCKERRWTNDVTELDRGLSLAQGCLNERFPRRTGSGSMPRPSLPPSDRALANASGRPRSTIPGTRG